MGIEKNLKKLEEKGKMCKKLDTRALHGWKT